MSTEETRKRKSPTAERQSVEENSSEPRAKIVKVTEKVTELNLEMHDLCGNERLEVKKAGEGPTSGPEAASCSISIKFRDEAMVETYKAKFLKFINSFIELQVRCPDEFSIELFRDDTLNPDEWVVIDDTETESLIGSVHGVSPTPSKKRKKHSKIKKELFVVDATPSPNTIHTDTRYTSKFTINTEKIAEENVDLGLKQMTCFNCDKLHSLKDCPEPKDYLKINAARNRFRQQPRSSRYHLEDQKFNHLVPGKVSNELRKALGLHSNETPHYVYLMRKLGYPPGWLEEAKFVHSNLNVFDLDGNFIKTSALKKHGLDPNKIVEFPGFNVPFEKGMKDDYRAFGVPPYSNDFSKESMISFFDKTFSKEQDNLETCDMDIDHEQEGISEEKEPALVVCENKENNTCDSPSLVDLEQQKLQLLEALNDEPKIENKNEDSGVFERDFLAVKTSSFGTPILKSNSPYSTLPNPDNFSKNVSPVINFENLPNATGKYEQMTDVLQKVRNTLKKIQNL